MTSPFWLLVLALGIANVILFAYLAWLRKQFRKCVDFCEDRTLKRAEKILGEVRQLRRRLTELPAGLRPETAARSVVNQVADLQKLLERELRKYSGTAQ